MQRRIMMLVALLLVACSSPLLAQKRVPASVWRQALGQQRSRLDDEDGDSQGGGSYRNGGDSDRDSDGGGYYSNGGYYGDTDSDADSDADSDGGRSQQGVRLPSDRYPSDPNSRSRQGDGGFGGILGDILRRAPAGGGAVGSARTGGVGSVRGRTTSGGIAGAIGRARDAGQVQTRNRQPAVSRRSSGGVGAVLEDVVRARSGEDTGATLSRVLSGLLFGGR